MTLRWLMLPLLAVGCEWIDDEADRERRDNDGDGLSLLDDCNDADARIGRLPAADAELVCDEVVSASVSGADRLATSTCLHPLRNGEELLLYGPAEDLWSLTLPTTGEVVVRLTPAPGFSQRPPGHGDDDDDDDEGSLDLELAGAVLWAWPEGTCPREHCHIATPLADAASGRLSGRADPEVRFDGQAGERWVLVVSAARGSGYTLTVDCP